MYIHIHIHNNKKIYNREKNMKKKLKKKEIKIKNIPLSDPIVLAPAKILF